MYFFKYVTISVKTRIVHTSMYIKKKIISEITHATGKYLQGLMGAAISEGSFKSTKTIHHLTCLAMESLFCFRSLNGECVTCICLQYSKRKQNRYRFLGKTATLDECTVIVSIAYLFGKSLVNILS